MSNSSAEPLRNRHLILLCTFRNIRSDLDFDLADKMAWQFKITLLSNHLSLNLFQWKEIISHLSSHERDLGEHSSRLSVQYQAASQRWRKLIWLALHWSWWSAFTWAVLAVEWKGIVTCGRGSSADSWSENFFIHCSFSAVNDGKILLYY